MRSSVLPAILIALVTAAVQAQTQTSPINADRPGLADGSTTLARGTIQIELGLERDDASQGGAGQRTLSTPTLLRYGITDSFELRIEGSGYQRARTEGGSESGWAPASLGMKLHLVDEKADVHLPSLGIIARAFVPSGSGAFRSEKVNGDLRLAADFTLNDRWSLNPHLGVAHDAADGLTSVLAALTIQCNISPTVGVFVDGEMQAPEQRGGVSSLLLDTGAAWIVGNDTQVDVSIGWGAHGVTPPNVFWSAGVSRRF
jgi:hypothetical protein